MFLRAVWNGTRVPIFACFLALKWRFACCFFEQNFYFACCFSQKNYSRATFLGDFWYFLLKHSVLDPKWFPRILTIAYESEWKMLQNEVHLVKKLWALFEIWEPWHPFFGNPEKQMSYSCILDNADTDSDPFSIFRVAIYLFVVQKTELWQPWNWRCSFVAKN